MPRAARFIARACIAVCALLAATTVRADWKIVEERFYALTLAGKPCGRSIERTERDAGLYRTTSRIEMRFVRLGQETRIDIGVEFTETESGEPVEAVVRQAGAEALRYRFVASGAGGPMKVEVDRGAAKETREIPSSDWLTPRETAALLAEAVPGNGAEIRYRTLDVQSGLVVAEIRMARGAAQRFERKNADSASERIDFETTSSVTPITAREIYDAKGRLVESAAPIGLGDLVSRLATQEAADRAYDEASFDLLAGTFVQTRPVAGWMARRSLVVELGAKGDRLPELPTVGAQQFVRVDARRARLEIDAARGSALREEDMPIERFLKPNESIDSDDPDVRAFLAAAKLPAKDGPGASFMRAEALRELVHQHLRDKNLATAFASAGDALRARGGDCTEHAVLLAALLRADGMPARVVSGLVYVPEFGGKGAGFAWHLWTQALVEPPVVDLPAKAASDAAAGAAGAPGRAWFDFDATLPGAQRFHAGHVAVGTTDLAGGASDPAFAQALSLVGGVSIEEVAP